MTTKNKTNKSLTQSYLQNPFTAASDVQTKDAVLLEATRAAFGSVPTGYINDGGAESDLKVVEIARNICSKSDK